MSVPLVLHGMNYRFKFKIQLYTIIKTKSVTIVYVYMYFLFYNLVGICVLMCLGVVCPRYATGVEHAHYTVHIVSIIRLFVCLVGLFHIGNWNS